MAVPPREGGARCGHFLLVCGLAPLGHPFLCAEHEWVGENWTLDRAYVVNYLVTTE